MADLWTSPGYAVQRPARRGQSHNPALTGQSRERRPEPATPRAAAAEPNPPGLSDQQLADLATLRLEPRLPANADALAQAITKAWPTTSASDPRLSGWGWEQVQAYRRLRQPLLRRG